jgi:2-methylisocitrate lyase-like PEP mutase family enzyme
MVLFILFHVLLLLLTQPATSLGLPLTTAACSPPQRLAHLLQSEMDGTRVSPTPILLPCCYDGLSARLVARAGFEATFMTGFGVSAVSGFPDTQLISFAEMQQAAWHVQEGLASVALEEQQQQQQQQKQKQGTIIPCIADGDTGYGNAVNVKRTLWGYGQAGMAGIMLEDQVSPKRCGHVAGKATVSRHEAIQRIKAACDARDDYSAHYGVGTGPLVLARTDAATTVSFQEAIDRCLAFLHAGADMTFLEAPTSLQQMQDYCKLVPGPKLANMLEHGVTPIVPPTQLKDMGYTMAAYPLTLLSASIRAMQTSLQRIQQGLPTEDTIATFAETKDIVGFTHYAKEEDRYK